MHNFVWTLYRKHMVKLHAEEENVCANSVLGNATPPPDGTRTADLPLLSVWNVLQVPRLSFLHLWFLVSINLHTIWLANCFLWTRLSWGIANLGNTHLFWFLPSYRPFQIRGFGVLGNNQVGWLSHQEHGQLVVITTRDWNWLNKMEETYDMIWLNWLST